MDDGVKAAAGTRAKLLGALLLGVGVGGALVAACGALLHPASAAVTVPRVPSPPPATPARPPAPAAQPTREGPEMTAREREVLARLARLPDLPVIQAPAFDLKVTDTTPRTAAAKTHPPTERNSSPGESVIARIQVVSVEKERVFYRSVDEQLHIARAGERLLGVNGRVLAIDEHGAELQIDGQRMRVAADNL